MTARHAFLTLKFNKMEQTSNKIRGIASMINLGQQEVGLVNHFSSKEESKKLSPNRSNSEKNVITPQESKANIEERQISHESADECAAQ